MDKVAASRREEPEAARGDGEHRDGVRGARLVSGGDSACLLELVHETLDAVALAVGAVVERRAPPVVRAPVPAPRDHGADTAGAHGR